MTRRIHSNLRSIAATLCFAMTVNAQIAPAPEQAAADAINLDGATCIANAKANDNGNSKVLAEALQTCRKQWMQAQKGRPKPVRVLRSPNT